MNEVGIAVLTIPNANILTMCNAGTDIVNMFVSVHAANELIEKTPTIIHFAVANTQNVIYPLGFTKPNAAHSINSESAQIFSAS